MIYNVDISSDDIITIEMVSNLYLCNGFTLTVNAVNDAPILLQPFEYRGYLEIQKLQRWCSNPYNLNNI